MTLRVAVTGIGGDVGRGTLQGLRRNSPHCEPIWILGLDANPEADASALVDAQVQLPLVKEAGYVEALATALRAHRIDVLLPGVDSEILVLSRARRALEASGALTVLAPESLVEAADDKLRTFEFLVAKGIGVPTTCDAACPVEIGFPIIAKPRTGHGSQGISLLSDLSALRKFLDDGPRNYCLQRHIDGPEITVGFLYDAHGVMCDAIAMERSLENGRTTRAVLVQTPEILRFVEDFGRKVSGIGAVNVQLRWSAQEGPMVFEINARLSGSTDIRVALGSNDPLRLARHFGRGIPIHRAQPQRAIVRRLGTALVVEPC